MEIAQLTMAAVIFKLTFGTSEHILSDGFSDLMNMTQVLKSAISPLLMLGEVYFFVVSLQFTAGNFAVI